MREEMRGRDRGQRDIDREMERDGVRNRQSDIETETVVGETMGH